MNRIWIEPEHPRKDEGKVVKGRSAEDIDRIGNERAALVSKMIERLGGQKDFCFWMERESCYCYGGKMGFVEATDDGHWFNLDFFGRTEG